MLAIWSDVDFLSAIREVKVDHETLLPMAKKGLWRQHELGVYCSQLRPLMALFCRANRAEQCRLSGVDRPTYAHCEVFAF